ncbi:MAG: hypothetical protein ACI379_16010 [Nocardioides sp.]|uniref:hypothetical protein n=1 Tax=Nocardioides sp. TaxID=35761 RepID=UPI003F06836C
MLTLLLTMLVGLLVAGAVVAYVAYPQRGEDLPVVPRLGEAMRKGAKALPVIDPDQPVVARPAPRRRAG